MNRKSRATEKGFTLVEMAIVILIIGMIVGSIFTFLTTQQNQKYLQQTQHNQQKIAAALTVFAENYGRLPCPATQNIAANAADYGNERATCTTNVSRKGIVPFRTLGLDQQDIIDGYKHAFTYVVSEAASAPVTTDVHANCRISDLNHTWIIGGVNVNPNKASFCCRAVGGNPLNIFNDRGRTIPASQGQANIAVDSVNTAAAANGDQLGYVAYLLISHGAEGGGYYILPSTGQQYPNVQPLQEEGEAEEDNASIPTEDDDRNFITMPVNRIDGDDHFDDIILWRTQQQVMSELHNNSCATP